MYSSWLRKIRVLSLLLLISFMGAHAQSKEYKTPYFISINYRSGKNEPHNDKVKNLEYPYRGVDLKLGWQTLGKQTWQEAFREPSFGVGLNWNTFNTDILGTPMAAYFFTNFPQISGKYFRIDLEIDLGLSYGIHPYDPISNPENFAIGAKVNTFFGFFLEQSFHVNPHIDLFVSEGFTHYSNGAMAYPNYGLNIPMFKLGARYHPHDMEVFPKSAKTKYGLRWEFNTYVATGRQTAFIPPQTFHEYTIAPAIYIRPSYKRRIGIGYELAYNEAITTVYETRNNTGKQLITQGIFAAHEFIIERFTINTQLGIYLKNQPSDTFYYERLGLGFYFTKHMRMVLGLKAQRFTAEYVEGALVFDLFPFQFSH
ncbi:MAG: acyloxyacyl hydrolase [Prolixibacteraceae bacterium]